MIEVKSLSKIYGQQKAVHEISFSAKKGEILGFLGPNGAGKSTTMKIATCYLAPSEGKVEICGYEVQESPMDVKKNVGYLPEHNPLYKEMYVHEYLEFIGNLHQIKGKILKNRIKEMIELCGLGREERKKIGTLSKGYRQRVGLAQALLHDPQVLILDEPTSGLDPNQIMEIRQVIKEISKEKTVIFSTHIMQEVEALCNRVVIINLGKIVADSTVEKLHQNKNTVFIEFDQNIDTQAFSQISDLENWENIGENKFVLNSQTDIRKEIFAWAVQNQWTLLEIRQEKSSLEDVFHRLTQK